MRQDEGAPGNPVRLQLSRRKGFDLQRLSREINGLQAVSVARPGKWGNPFVIGRDGDAAQCVAKCRAEYARMRRAEPERFRALLEPLRGKNLACWCRPGEPCHADLLIGLANGLAIEADGP